jgi:thiamine kinase-like enzyme
VSIDEVVARIDEWRGRAVTVRPLPGGITNTNYRVDVDGEAFVVRIPGVGTDLLGIDRENERHSAEIAAQLGLGPRVAHHLADLQVMVCTFVDGRSPSIADLRGPGMPTRLARTVRQLHAGPRFRADFSMLRLIDAYLARAETLGARLFPDVGDRRRMVARIGAALAVRPAFTVPCHNDLLPENWIDDGQRLWILDYEYSGNNDSTFELGNLCQELVYDDERITELCAAYFGMARPDQLARVRLQMIVSDVGWALWAALQAVLSGIDFDFWRYGTERWARAAVKLDSPAFGAWLDAVRRPG